MEVWHPNLSRDAICRSTATARPLSLASSHGLFGVRLPCVNHRGKEIACLFIRYPVCSSWRLMEPRVIFILFFFDTELLYGLPCRKIEQGKDLHSGSPASAGFFRSRVRQGFSDPLTFRQSNRHSSSPRHCRAKHAPRRPPVSCRERGRASAPTRCLAPDRLVDDPPKMKQVAGRKAICRHAWLKSTLGAVALRNFDP